MTSRKADLIERLHHEQRHWRDLVAMVGRERMDEPGPMGEWTFKDLVSHLAGWRARTIARLEAAVEGRGEPPPPWPAEMGDDDDAINAWMRERDRARPLDDVLAEYDASFDRLAALTTALPDDAVTTPGHFRWLGDTALADGPFFGHLHEEHEPAIRQWLASRA